MEGTLYQATSFMLSSTVSNPYDYLGRSFLHIPQDVDVDLRSDEPPGKCYAPKKLLHTW